jgi:hypothetical protein
MATATATEGPRPPSSSTRLFLLQHRIGPGRESLGCGASSRVAWRQCSGERGRHQGGQAGHGEAGATAGADAALDHHGGVVAGDTKVDPEPTNRRWQVHGGSSTRPSRHNHLGRFGDAPTTATVPGHIAYRRPGVLHSCAAAGPGPTGRPLPEAGRGRCQGGNQQRETTRHLEPLEPNLWRLPRPAGRAMQPGPAAINSPRLPT